MDQAGFLRHYGWPNSYFENNNRIERYTEYNLPLYIAFIDYSKAFDSICHNSIWQALHQQVIDNDYIELI